MIKSKFKFKKVVSLWLWVFFYSIVSYLIVVCCGIEKFSAQNFLMALVPLLTNRYWFFTAYILLYLLSYFLNKMILNSSKKALKILIVFSFIFAIFMEAGIGSIVNLEFGYNLLWFIVLYIVGAYLKLYPPKIKKIFVLLIYIASTLILWGGFYIPENNIILYALHMICSSFYTAPFCFIASVSIFLLFKDIKCKNVKLNKFITFISSCTFGIYLLQESNLKSTIYHTLFKVELYWASPLSPLYVLGFALALFALGLASEFIRKPIFYGVGKLVDKIKVQPFALKMKEKLKRYKKSEEEPKLEEEQKFEEQKLDVQKIEEQKIENEQKIDNEKEH